MRAAVQSECMEFIATGHIIVAVEWRAERWPGMMPVSTHMVTGLISKRKQRSSAIVWEGMPHLVVVPEGWQPRRPWPEDTMEAGTLDVITDRLCEHCGARIPEACLGVETYVCPICGNGGAKPSLSAEVLVDLVASVPH